MAGTHLAASIDQRVGREPYTSVSLSFSLSLALFVYLAASIDQRVVEHGPELAVRAEDVGIHGTPPVHIPRPVLPGPVDMSGRHRHTDTQTCTHTQMLSL